MTIVCMLLYYIKCLKITKLNDCIRNTTAVCSNVAAVGYSYVCANSDHLHMRGELFGQIGAHHQ